MLAMRSLRALLALALPGASGLRALALQEKQGPAEQVNLLRDREGALPPRLRQFKRTWTTNYKREEHLWEPRPASIQLVLGVLTTLDLGAQRDVIRRTWLNQAGVCYWSPEPRAGCSVYVAFVYGARGVALNARGKAVLRHNLTEAERAKAKLEEGMLELDIEENMNNGKSFVWMSTALQRFPWATHIGKIDMDTYPFVYKLLTRMSQNTTCAEGVSPYQIIGRPGYSCPGEKPPYSRCAFKHSCAADACLGQFSSDLDFVPIGGAWNFAFGELYIFSMPLMRIMDWTPTHGNEDRVVSDRVDRAMASTNGSSCLAFRRLDAHAHQAAWDLAPMSRRFANSL